MNLSGYETFVKVPEETRRDLPICDSKTRSYTEENMDTFNYRKNTYMTKDLNQSQKKIIEKKIVTPVTGKENFLHI